MELEGKVALVTGSSRGIGRRIAVRLAEAGAGLLVNYHSNLAAAERVGDEIRALGREVLVFRADVTEPVEVQRLVEAGLSQFGSIDILVNNVGIFHWRMVDEMSISEWHSVFASNLHSAFYTSQAVLPIMRRKRWGRIVNLGAVRAESAFGQAKIAAYSAAKAALVAFSRSLALEEARHGITVNVISPGIVDDKELDREEALRIRDVRFPVGRPNISADVAEAALFFVSDRADFVTGQVLTVAGGWML